MANCIKKFFQGLGIDYENDLCPKLTNFMGGTERNPFIDERRFIVDLSGFSILPK